MSLLLQFKAAAEDAGSRLDDCLYSRVGTLSRMKIRNLILGGGCKLNGEVARPGSKLSLGDEVEFRSDDDTPGAMDPDPIPLEILFEDQHILVVVKPAGMLVHPTLGVKRGTLANALAHHLNPAGDESLRGRFIRPGLVHRLDMATSGLMVIAKTQRALS